MLPDCRPKSGAARIGGAILATVLCSPVAVLAQNNPEPAPSRPVEMPTRDSLREQAEAIAAVRKNQQAKRNEEALRAAQRGVRRFPRNTQLRFLLGVTQSDIGKPDEAIATFEALTRDHPELAEPYNNLAVLHASRGDLNAAREALDAALRVVPDYPLALENLGDIYLRMAQQSYQRAIDADKATPNLKRKLTRATAVVETLTPAQ